MARRIITLSLDPTAPDIYNSSLINVFKQRFEGDDDFLLQPHLSRTVPNMSDQKYDPNKMLKINSLRVNNIQLAKYFKELCTAILNR